MRGRNQEQKFHVLKIVCTPPRSAISSQLRPFHVPQHVSKCVWARWNASHCIGWCTWKAVERVGWRPAQRAAESGIPRGVNLREIGKKAPLCAKFSNEKRKRKSQAHAALNWRLCLFFGTVGKACTCFSFRRRCGSWRGAFSRARIITRMRSANYWRTVDAWRLFCFACLWLAFFFISFVSLSFKDIVFFQSEQRLLDVISFLYCLLLFSYLPVSKTRVWNNTKKKAFLTKFYSN